MGVFGCVGERKSVCVYVREGVGERESVCICERVCGRKREREHLGHFSYRELRDHIIQKIKLYIPIK